MRYFLLLMFLCLVGCGSLWAKKEIKTTFINNKPLLTEKVIAVESSGNPKAVSSAYAIGLMQVKLSTAQPIARRLLGREITMADLKDPLINVLIGQNYLLEMIHRFGSIEAALQAYNVGPTAYDRGIRNPRYSRKVLNSEGL